MEFKTFCFKVCPDLEPVTRKLWLDFVGRKDDPNKRNWHDTIQRFIRVGVYLYTHKDFLTEEQRVTLNKIAKGEKTDIDI